MSELIWIFNYLGWLGCETSVKDEKESIKKIPTSSVSIPRSDMTRGQVGNMYLERDCTKKAVFCAR